MTSRIKALLTVLLVGCVTAALPADGGHFEGNGGDYIRATFLRMGQAVVQHLRTRPEGQAVVSSHALDLDALAATLTIDVVKVSETPLVDNGGSAVDAIGVPGSITLYHDAWFEHFEKERDVYFLVFHEMLRAAGVADDDFVVSGALRPFPEDERVPTAIEDAVPLIAGDGVADLVDISHLAVNGSGCPSGFGTLVDFDAGRNQLGLRLTDFAVVNERKNCVVSLQMKGLPAGKRLEVTQLDALAEVDLPAGASFTFTADAYLAGTISTAVPEKTVTAGASPLAGRTLLRANTNLLKTVCGAGPGLLNFATSARTQGQGRVLDVALSLRLVDCRQ